MSAASVIPESCVQFLDLKFDVGPVGRVACAFSEEATDDGRMELCQLRQEGDGYVESRSGKPSDPLYIINAQKALEPFMGKWVPMPLLRRRGHGDGGSLFDKGPSNWARLRIAELHFPDRQGNSHHAVLALDTAVEETRPDDPYSALSPEDVETGEEFILATDLSDVDWFLDLPWVDDWLTQLHREARQAARGERPLRDSDFPFACEHLARYLTLLAVLDKLRLIPRLRLVDPRKYTPIDVDLVLDVGNSRTCGLLIERYPDRGIDLNDSRVLTLRDLGMPERRQTEPFDSRIEFALAAFGKPALSRRSGRRREAFHWPTVARVGAEAARLATLSVGAEGATGMSSPKRYLWDTRQRVQDWRLNAASVVDDPATEGTEPPVTIGSFVQYVNDAGLPLTHLKPGQPADPAFWSRYSRSSLMMFALAEILLQALVAINGPQERAERSHADLPRRLRRVILTIPTAMPLSERRLYRKWAKWAVEMLWLSLGWQDEDGTLMPGRPKPPEMLLKWDEASATQLVYLYTEIAQKYQGDVRTLFGLIGRVRGGQADSTLRVASIDIGGGTTDLIITTYSALGHSASAVIRPAQEFREGFSLAGDDVLAAVIERHMLPAMGRALSGAGIGDAKALMTNLFGGNFGGQSELQRNRRRQFAHQIWVPAALAALRLYEAGADGGPRKHRVPLMELVGSAPEAPTVRYFEEALGQASARLDLADIMIDLDLDAIDETVRAVIGPMMADLAELVHHYGCDVLLISGRPSRLPAVRDALLAKLPVPPDRILAMHRYRVGNWYPFRDVEGRIADPKTTAAVGAMLCALAEGQLEGFMFQSDRLELRSTARFVGEMELSGEIRKEKVFFANLDLDDPRAALPSHSFDFYAPVFIGFRQLPVERWPATPLYRLGFATSDAMARARERLPYKVTLERVSEEDEEDFRIVEITDREQGPVLPRELELRLQTLKTADGHWLDTGTFTIL